MFPHFLTAGYLKSSVLLGTAIGAVSLLYTYYKRCQRSYKLKAYFKDKIVLITGASSGLGKELGIQLHELGARLILAARSLDKLTNLSQDLSRFPLDGTHEPVCRYLDLSDEDTLTDVGGLMSNGIDRIDVLINNAGVSSRAACVHTDIHVHKQIMQVNHFGQICLTQNLLPYLRKGVEVNGVANIVAVNSVQGFIAIPMRSAYAASKHAFKAYMDSLRAELSVTDPGMRVTVINPGYINTNLSKNALTGSGAKHDKMDENTLTGVPPADVARLVLENVCEGNNEVLACSIKPRIAIVLRYLLPSLYFYIMTKRAAKEYAANTPTN